MPRRTGVAANPACKQAGPGRHLIGCHCLVNMKIIISFSIACGHDLQLLTRQKQDMSLPNAALGRQESPGR